MSVHLWSAPPLSQGDPEPPISLTVLRRGPVTVAAVGGELDMDTSPWLTRLVAGLIEDRPVRLVLDLAGVTFCGAAGLRSLLLARQEVSAANGLLVLRNPSPVTRQVLALTHLADAFQIQLTDG
jgi:anti-anti-sigma factor